MVGTRMTAPVAKREVTAGDVALSVAEVSLEPQASGGGRLRDMALEVRCGEILGIAGVEGNGQTELAEVIAGLRRPESGRISLLGRDVTAMGPRQVSEAGLSYIPADRGVVGVVGAFNVGENLILKAFRRQPFARRSVLQLGVVGETAGRLAAAFDIRMASAAAPVAALSGGNLQKVILAREIGLADAAVIVAMHPTRGLDVGSTQYVHQQLVEQRNRGAAVLLISADLDEVLGISDRVGVIVDGTIVDSAPIAGVDREWLGPRMGTSMRSSV
jgi:simple sugar transport system ATP-binding protein